MNDEREYTGSDEVDLSGAELLIDGNRGIYIPQLFVQHYGHLCPKLDEGTIAVLQNGPDDEWYWDSWGMVLDNMTITNEKGETFWLHQGDGDLWAVPV